MGRLFWENQQNSLHGMMEYYKEMIQMCMFLCLDVGARSLGSKSEVLEHTDHSCLCSKDHQLQGSCWDWQSTF